MVGPMLARVVVGATPGRRAIVAVCGASTLSYCAFYAVFPAAAARGAFALAAVLVALAHLGGGAQWSISTYGLQHETPDQFRGRVLSLDYGLATLAIGASSIAAGMLADAYGEATATWSLAAIAACYSVAWLAWSLRGAPAP
jgi:hypothetical protein